MFIDVDKRMRFFEDRIRSIDSEIDCLNSERADCVNKINLLSELYSSCDDVECTPSNSKKLTVREQILNLLEERGECKISVILREVSGSSKSVYDVLYRLQVKGEVIRPGRGIYKLTGFMESLPKYSSDDVVKGVLNVLCVGGKTPMEISENLPHFSYSSVYNALKKLKKNGILYSDESSRYYYKYK